LTKGRIASHRCTSTVKCVCVTLANFVAIGQTITELSRFFDFQDGGRTPSWFSKVRHFNAPWGGNGQHAKYCGDRRNRYRDIAIFYFLYGGRQPCWIFIKFAILTADRVKRVNLRRRTKFYVNRSNSCRDIAIFWLSRWWPSAILVSYKFEFLRPGRVQKVTCTIMPNFVAIWRFIDLFLGDRF